MKNFVQDGRIVTVTAPAAMTSGLGYLVGSLFGVACASFDSGDTKAEMQVEGVFDLVKVGSEAWALGDRIYWDAGNARCTKVATAGQLIGTALAVVGSGADETTGRVRLNGVVPSTAEGPQTAIASFTMGANITAATANNALTDSSATNPTEAQFNELAKELGTKVNDILVALRAAGILAT